MCLISAAINTAHWLITSACRPVPNKQPNKISDLSDRTA